MSGAVVIPLRKGNRAVDERPDRDLVMLAQEGNRSAQGALFRRYASMVAGMGHRQGLRSAEVDDLVQDTFIKAFRSIGSLRDPAAFRSWLGTLTIRASRDALRRRSRRRKIGGSLDDAVELDRVIATDTSPEVTAELRAIYSVIESLPTDARVVLVLRRVEGMTIPEVAEHLGKSPATIKRRLREAEIALRQHLRGWDS